MPRSTGTLSWGTSAKRERVVRLGEDRLRQVLADLVLVDVERGHELDVADVVAAEVDVHQARDEVAILGVGVVVAALDEAAGAVADADDGDADLAVAGPMAVAWRPCRSVEATMLSSPCCRVRRRLAEAPDVPDALDDGRHGQRGDEDEDADQDRREAEPRKRHAGDDEHEPLGARREPDAGRQADPLGARAWRS